MLSQNAPSIFNYAAGKLWYAAAVHGDDTIVGDPLVLSSAQRAAPGETIAVFVDGLAASPARSLITQAITYSEPLSAMIGESQALVVFAGLTSVGEFQLNIQVPPSLAAGTYPISVSTAGQTSPPGVVIPVGP